PIFLIPEVGKRGEMSDEAARSGAWKRRSHPRFEMFIQVEATNDPAQLRFLPGRPVFEAGPLEFGDRQAASASPLAARLFEVDGVSALTLGPDTITITKKSGEWQYLK